MGTEINNWWSVSYQNAKIVTFFLSVGWFR